MKAGNSSLMVSKSKHDRCFCSGFDLVCDPLLFSKLNCTLKEFWDVCHMLVS